MFGNKSKPRKVVKNAESYLKATDVVSRPIAILMGVVGLVIVGALLLGVFFGGKWAYNKIRGDEPVPVVTVPQDGPGESANTENTQQEFPALEQGPEEVPAQTPPTTNPAPAQTPTPAPAPAAVPNTGPSVIPDTGPGSGE